MDESILNNIRKMLGFESDYKHFDTDIIILINSSIFELMQLGIGPQKGFSIKDESSTWADLIDDRVDIEGVKTYIYMSVKMIFDPPTPHYAASALTDKVKELGWRLNAQVESYAPPDSPEEETYSGTFDKTDFNSKGWLTISADVHLLGPNAIVDTIDMYKNSKYSNVVCDHRTLLNGDVRIISDTPFSGRIILRRKED